jgi:hypothetical protein
LRARARSEALLGDCALGGGRESGSLLGCRARRMLAWALFVRSLMVLPLAAAGNEHGRYADDGCAGRYDWAEDHHDVELMNEAGRTLARARLSEGAAGMARLHALIGEHAGAGDEEAEVQVGIETDRGLWVTALVASGYQVLAVNPLQAARYRERHAVSGARSDAGDAHMLADMVRTDAHQLRPVAADSPQAQAVKVVARAHKTLIWERYRQRDRLRYQLRDFFPAALDAYRGLGLESADVLELPAKAPDPASAAKLTTAQAGAVLTRGHRRHIADKTAVIRAALRARSWRSQARSRQHPPRWYGRSPRSSSPSASKPRCSKVRWRHISARTRTLRSSCPSRASAWSPAPGCSPSPAMTRPGMPAPRPARTTRPPAPSPASPARRRS